MEVGARTLVVFTHSSSRGVGGVLFYAPVREVGVILTITRSSPSWR